MDHDGSTFDYPTSTGQDSVTLQHTTLAPNPLAPWGGDFQSYTMASQVDWSSTNIQYPFTTDQEYLASLQAPLSMPTEHTSDSVSQLYFQQSQPGPMPDACYSSQVCRPSASPAQTQTALDSLMPGDNNSTDRPLSMFKSLSPGYGTDFSGAGTMLDSASSNTSRPSSNNSSPSTRAPKFKVPAIKTQFESKGRATTLVDTTLSDGFQVAPDNDSITSMSNGWIQMYHNTEGQDLHEQQSLSPISGKTTSALLEPFDPTRWQSPGTRRTSISSAASGPMFSPFGTGTPGSALWQQGAINSPYPQNFNWTPTSNPGQLHTSPQSPYQFRAYASLGRASQLDSQREAKRLRLSTTASLPSRKPRSVMRHATNGCATTLGLPGQSTSRMGSNRMRPRGESTSQPSSATSQPLLTPEYQLSSFYTSPDVSQAEFQISPGVHTPTRHVLPSSTMQTPMGPPQRTPRTNLTPGFNAFNMGTPFVGSQPIPHLATNNMSNSSHTNPIATPPHQPPLPVPSEPPMSDFVVQSNSRTGSSSADGHSHHHHGPIRQSPHFEGDIYTPRFKRRNAAGKWEGWCGYCQPGRWLDLKNSRFWEDKLRNHGVCARTKTFFESPIRVRWVSDRGTIWEGEAGDSGFDMASKEGIEDDGVGRKREGLCGECNNWIPMDGMRTRGKGKCVAWWMHAYKCHEQSKLKTGGT